MPTAWTVTGRDAFFLRPRHKIELFWSGERELYEVERTRLISIPVQFGAIGAGGNTGWKQGDDVRDFFKPKDEGYLYHWIPLLDLWQRVYFRYAGKPQLGTFRAPELGFFDYEMASQLHTYAIASANSKFMPPFMLEMFSMEDRMPDIWFSNLDGVAAHTLTMTAFGKAYKLRKIGEEELGKVFTTIELGQDPF